jgi:hypothetical protein
MRYLLGSPCGRRDAQLRPIRSSLEKSPSSSFGLLLRCQSRERLRRPWMSGMPGARDRWRAKTSRRWVPCCGFDPSALFERSVSARNPDSRSSTRGSPASLRSRLRGRCIVPSSRIPLWEGNTSLLSSIVAAGSSLIAATVERSCSKRRSSFSPRSVRRWPSIAIKGGCSPSAANQGDAGPPKPHQG